MRSKPWSERCFWTEAMRRPGPLWTGFSKACGRPGRLPRRPRISKAVSRNTPSAITRRGRCTPCLAAPARSMTSGLRCGCSCPPGRQSRPRKKASKKPNSKRPVWPWNRWAKPDRTGGAALARAAAEAVAAGVVRRQLPGCRQRPARNSWRGRARQPHSRRSLRPLRGKTIPSRFFGARPDQGGSFGPGRDQFFADPRLPGPFSITISLPGPD